MSDERGVGLKGWLSGQKAKNTRIETKPVAVTLEKHRVAVLPLANLTPGAGDEYFADGMTEELISTLAGISGLRVISRTSIIQYKNTNKKAVEIGRELAAGSIIEGTVRKIGNQVRITVQLIDASEDEHLWAQTYDRELKDVFSMQSDIARNVSETLRVKLLPRESAQLQKRSTPSLEAYTLYLKGRYHWNTRSAQGVKKAIDYFETAIEQDPNYALAYAGLADSYFIAVDWEYMAAAVAYPMAKEAAMRALELDNGLAEAHASLGLTHENEWNWREAEEEYKLAISLNPNYASARLWYSLLLAALGRSEEALTEIERAAKTDPLSPLITVHVGARLFELGRFDKSVEEMKKAVEIQPDFSYAWIYLALAQAKMNDPEGITECERMGITNASSNDNSLLIAETYAFLGRKKEAQGIVDNCMKNFQVNSTTLVYAARALSVLGDKDRAMELLWRGYERHSPNLWKIGVPGYHSLNSDTRFTDLLKKMGLRK